jgi:hypothetical protein
VNPNTGHGHVRPRPDGVRARCGGPGLCNECSQEKAALDNGGSVVATVAPTQASLWQPIEAAPPEVWEIAKAVAAPKLGAHIGQCHTLSDGRWLVLKFSNLWPGKPDFFCLLPTPPDFTSPHAPTPAS